MTKHRYSKEIKEKACEMALQGIHLKIIQAQLGPNPKAVQRYLTKRGVDYEQVKNEMKPKTVLQVNKERNATRKQNKKQLSSIQAAPAIEYLD